MTMHRLGLLLIVVGAVLAVASLSLDVIGLGGFPGIGWKQGAGIAAGVIAVVVGWVVLGRAGQSGRA